MRRAALAMPLLLGCTALAGCEAHADEHRLVDTLLCAETDAVTGVWQSAPWPPAEGDCAWLPYEGRLTLEVRHGLGRVPKAVLVYLAFDPSGGGGALSAGDTAHVQAVTADTVTIRNDTEGDYFVRIVLQ